MAARPIKPWLKQALELGPPVLFFALFLWIRDETYLIGGREYSGFIVAAGVFVPILLVAMAVLWWLTGKLSRMQIFTIVIVVFFGALTLWFNDEQFFKLKTTIKFGFFAALLGIGLLRGRSYLEYVLGEYLPMEHEGWMILTRRLCLFFLGVALINEVVWRSMSDTIWVSFDTFAIPIAMFVFLGVQIAALQEHLIEEPAEK